MIEQEYFFGPNSARPATELLSEAELGIVLQQRFGFMAKDLEDLADGQALVDLPISDLNRGIFAHSAEGFLSAESETDKQQAWQYFYNDVAAQLLEAVTKTGHFEEFVFDIDQATGDALVYGSDNMGMTYLRDMAVPTYKWRAKLSFVELINSAKVAELSKRGCLQDYVVIESSCYAYDAPLEQAKDVGYNPNNQKAYLRAHTDRDGQRVLQTLSYSHLTPAETTELYTQLGVRNMSADNTAEALANLVLIRKSTFESMGGLSGLSQKIDQIKSQSQAKPVYFGESADTKPMHSDYEAIPQKSAERKVRAAEITHNLAENMLLIYQSFKAGLISTAQVTEMMGTEMLSARNAVLKNDRDLALEQFGLEAAEQIDEIAELYLQGRFEEAVAAEIGLQKTLGTIYICGLQVRIDNEGNLIGPNGEALDCPEIRNGQEGKCPGCNHVVKIIVESKEKLFCPRSECPLSRSGGRKVPVKTEVSSHSKQKQSVAEFIIKGLRNENFALAQ